MTAALVLWAAPQEEGDALSWARSLDELDLSTSVGHLTVGLSGQLDLAFFAFGDEAPGWLVEDPAVREGDYDRSGETADSPEFVGILRVFVEGTYSTWFEYLVEGRADVTTFDDVHGGGRAEQAWVRFKVPDRPELNFEAGKFAPPIGNFIPRSSSAKNPLTTWPLVYDLPTSFANFWDAGQAILNRRDAPDVKDWVVPIWQAVYGWGAMTFGSWDKLSWSAAVTTSAPATRPELWDREAVDPDFANAHLHASYAPHASTTVGASWSRGPYEKEDSWRTPASPEHAYQTLAGLDASYMTGHLEVYAEAYWTRIEAPQAGDLDLWTWYVEGKYTILPELFAAARLAQMVFGDVEGSDGRDRRWDRNRWRYELGAGYLFTPNFFVKATGQLNVTSGGREPSDNLLMMQVGLGF